MVLRPTPAPPRGAPPDPFDPPAVVTPGTSEFGGADDPSRQPWFGEPGAPVWPSHRVAITLAGGGAKDLTVMVVEAPYGYLAEVRDTAGRVVATEPPTTDVAVRRHWNVAVLTSADIDRVIRPAVSSAFATELGIVRLSSASQLPEDPLLFAGLQALLISDFDTASLTPSQIRAVGDFVGLGGLLVLGGGTSWARTLASLPDPLLPLRPNASAEVSIEGLAPIEAVVALEAAVEPSAQREDLLPEELAKARVTAETAARTSVPIATGEVLRGRVLVRAGDNGPPLMVLADHGSGHVVQMAYDPFSEPFASKPELAFLGLRSALSPALALLGSGARRSGSGGQTDHLWSPLGSPPTSPLVSGWPRWPNSGSGVLGLWLLLAGPAVYLVFRRRRSPSMGWLAIPALAVVLAGCGAIAITTQSGHGGGPALLDNVVELRRLGPDSTALLTRFHGLASTSAEPLHMDLDLGELGSSVVTQPDVPMPGSDVVASRTSAFAQPVAESIQRRGVDLPTALAGGPEVSVGAAGSSRLRTGAAAPGAVQTVQTLALEHGGGSLDIDLRFTGSSEERALTRVYEGVVRGVVTNNTGMALRDVRIFVGRGQVTLASVLQPNASVRVDAAVAYPGRPSFADTGGDSELTIRAAPFFYPPGPGQAVLVGTTDPPKRPSSTQGVELNLVLQTFALPGMDPGILAAA